MAVLTILKIIYPTRKWLLSHIPIQARGMMPSTQLMETGQRVWGQKELVLTLLTRWCGEKWILAGSITFTISTSCSKHTTVLVRNHIICFCVFYASNKFSDSNFFLLNCKNVKSQALFFIIIFKSLNGFVLKSARCCSQFHMDNTSLCLISNLHNVIILHNNIFIILLSGIKYKTLVTTLLITTINNT